MFDPPVTTWDDEPLPFCDKPDFVLVYIGWLLRCIDKHSRETKGVKVCRGVWIKTDNFIFKLPDGVELDIRWMHINYGGAEFYNAHRNNISFYPQFTTEININEKEKVVYIFLETIGGDLATKKIREPMVHKLFPYFYRLIFKEDYKEDN